MDCVRNEDGRPTLRERGWGVLSRWLDMREKKEREKVLFLRAHGFVARGILVLECALEKEMRTWVEREKKKSTMNQRRTARARASLSCASAMAAKRCGRSHQYAAGRWAGRSKKQEKKDTRELCEGGGGENKRRSGEGGEIARDGGDAVCVCDVSRWWFSGNKSTSTQRFEEGRPGTTLGNGHSLGLLLVRHSLHALPSPSHSSHSAFPPTWSIARDGPCVVGWGSQGRAGKPIA